MHNIAIAQAVYEHLPFKLVEFISADKVSSAHPSLSCYTYCLNLNLNLKNWGIPERHPDSLG